MKEKNSENSSTVLSSQKVKSLSEGTCTCLSGSLWVVKCWETFGGIQRETVVQENNYSCGVYVYFGEKKSVIDKFEDDYFRKEIYDNLGAHSKNF